MNKQIYKKRPGKKVVIYTTGGTINSSYDRRSAKITPGTTDKNVLDMISSDDNEFAIELNEYSNLPGPHLTPQFAFQLARDIDHTLEKKDVAGVVVLQGTDTLDEISYMVHLVQNSQKPTVFTGAMKSYNEPYEDALGNVIGAVRVAADKEFVGKGVLVFFNEEIFSAEEVVKYHANNVAAFRSLHGPIGNVFNDQIIHIRTPLFTRLGPVSRIEQKVELIKVVSGMDDTLIRAALSSGARGIVIEGFGAGNVPPSIVPAIREAVSRNIPVVVCSRCYDGIAIGVYDYEGGGARLKQYGVIHGGAMSGHKARIKLMVLLGLAKSLEEIQSCFKI